MGMLLDPYTLFPSGGPALPVTFVAATSNNVDSGASGAQTLIVNKPVGVNAGDFLLFLVLGSDNFNIAPSGIAMTNYLDFNSSNKIRVYGRTAIIGEPASYTFAFNFSAPKVGLACLAYQNASTVSIVGTPAAGSVAGSIVASVAGMRVSVFINESFSTTCNISGVSLGTLRINTPNRRYAHIGASDDLVPLGATAAVTGTWSSGPTAPFAYQLIVN